MGIDTDIMSFWGNPICDVSCITINNIRETIVRTSEVGDR